MNIKSLEMESMKRDDIVPYYVDLIKRDASQKDVKDFNKKIISRWSIAALIYIKEKAWKIVNRDEKPDLKNIVILGQFTDGKARQILANKLDQLNIINILTKTSKDGKIHVIDTSIDGVEWKSEIDLRK